VVVADLASRPGTCTVAGHAVVTTGPDTGTVGLDRVFALDDRLDGRTEARRCVVDRRRYELRA
jgi:hypothetical protein